MEHLQTAVSPSTLGWPVVQRGNATLLSTTSGFCGVEVGQRFGAAMISVLREADAAGPVAAFPLPRRTYIFLAEADVVLDGGVINGLGASLLRAPAVIPLPPTDTEYGRLYWIIPPSAGCWLPSLSTVRWALATAVDRVNGVEPAPPKAS